jgi:hypothetical protein
MQWEKWQAGKLGWERAIPSSEMAPLWHDTCKKEHSVTYWYLICEQIKVTGKCLSGEVDRSVWWVKLPSFIKMGHIDCWRPECNILICEYLNGTYKIVTEWENVQIPLSDLTLAVMWRWVSWKSHSPGCVVKMW